MNGTNLFKIALRALANNKLRAFLTMLGIIIGVASVRKEVVHNRLTDHADLSRTLYIGFRKHISAFYTQLTDVEVLQPDTADG